jgi:hypothetical protein
MEKLHEFLGRKIPKPGDFGIEIEVEGKNLPNVDDQFWKSEADGSLRGESLEYVLKNPITLKNVIPALSSLEEQLADSELDFSFRTSVHVHVNVQALSHVQILNMIYTYLLLEEPCMTYCGKERKGNRFCLRLQDAEGILDTLQILFRGDLTTIGFINEDQIRYAAINLGALNKYGSLEFRAMKGNIDVEKLSIWVLALNNIREYAKNSKSPKEILEDFRKLGTKEFLNLVMKEVAVSFVYPKMDRDMQQSCSLSIDLPYCYEEEVLPVKKARKVEALAGAQFFEMPIAEQVVF